MRDPALFQASSVGVLDPQYNLGPGDQIIVMLWGETQFRQVFNIDREGFIFIPDVGQVFVNGLNFKMLESKLFRLLSQAYDSLNPQGRKPTTFLDVSLGDLRPLRIQVLGEVSQPGAYTVNPSATLFSSLYYFNGPTTLGSLRNISLIRSEEEIAKIDFYDYLLTGKKPNDQKLQLDDIVFIPPREKTVSISGEINRPGIYELLPNETIKDLVSLCGGFKETAYLELVQIDRIASFQEREELGINRKIEDIDFNQVLHSENKYFLRDGDHIYVSSISDTRSNIVTINGAVNRPGVYEFEDSLNIIGLIDKADGLSRDAHQDRVEIIRLNEKNEKKLIKFNLANALEPNSSSDIQLKEFDIVSIFSSDELIEKEYVFIEGYIKKPGKYGLLKNMTIADLVFLGGGFEDKNWKNQSYLKRADLLRNNPIAFNKSIYKFDLGEILLDSAHNQNIKLENNDIVRIYSKETFNYQKPIHVNGVVRNPGKYQIKDMMTLKDLILEAGGFSESVYRYKVEVARIDPKNTNISKYAEIIEFAMLDNFNIETGFNNEVLQTFLLEPYDYISIRPDPFFKMQKKVEIKGAVKFPGEYVLSRPDETLIDIINRSGGLNQNAYPLASTFSRKESIVKIDLDKILKSKNSKGNIIMHSGDKINVAVRSTVVNIIGEVSAPGYYKYSEGRRVKDYINLAGGLTLEAENDNIYISYPNGESRRYSPIFNNHKVLDGSAIIIGKKKEEDPFDVTEFAKEITLIGANFAQIIATFMILQNNR
tara:strand:- start:499 stop:2793 length:2295 start_codon:yes stop_codon:yes gene_type:complete